MNNIRPSNTAIPKYYATFRQSVLDGKIPVCNEISMEMNRIDDRVKDPEQFYDPRPVEAFLDFCESELTKTDGTSLEVLDSFKLWGEQLFGWYYFAKETRFVKNKNSDGSFEEVEVFKRLIRKQYLIVARGAAKTMYLYFVQAYFLIIDSETTHQITTAPTMIQAREVLAPFKTAITRAPGPLFQFLTNMRQGISQNSHHTNALLSSTKRGIEFLLTGSLLEVRPMSINKLQGLRSKVNTVDEWLSVDINEDVIGALEQGASKLPDYVIVAATSEGTVRNGPGDDMKIELLKILKREYPDKHTSIFHYRMDTIKEVGDPRLWMKAQPNIGITVSYEAYHNDVKRAKLAPSTRNDILAKRFNIPMQGSTHFFTYEETIPHRPRRSYSNMDCAVGADLSQGDDFCAFTFLFPIDMAIGRVFGVKSINFITERTLKGLPTSARIKYDEFLKEKSLFVMPGSILDMEAVFFALIDEMDKRGYIVHALGYDPYNADSFVKLWKANFGPFGIETVRQGVRTESVPLGEIKKMSEDRKILFDESIFSFAMSNAMVVEDNNGNRKLYKRRYESKIDPVSALMDAWVAYSRHPELFN